jgi:hypothetical protein
MILVQLYPVGAPSSPLPRCCVCPLAIALAGLIAASASPYQVLKNYNPAPLHHIHIHIIHCRRPEHGWAPDENRNGFCHLFLPPSLRFT